MDNQVLSQQTPAPIQFKLPCGITLSGFQWGAESPSPCLLIHGLDNHARVWDEIAQKLCRLKRVYTIDLRGHGDSDWADPKTYNLESFVKDIELIRTQLGLQKVNLIGHSLGGRIAIHYASKYSQHVETLTVLDTSPEFNKALLEQMRLQHNPSSLSFQSYKDYREHLQSIYMLADPISFDQFARHSYTTKAGRYLSKTDPDIKTAILGKPTPSNSTAPNQRNTTWNLLPQIHIPTLLLRGAYSSALSASTANEMREMLPNAELVSVDSAGHALMLDNPQKVASTVVDFIRRKA